MVYILVQDNEFSHEINYTFDLLFNIMGVTYSFDYEKATENDIVVIYGEDSDIGINVKKLIIKKSENLFNKNYLKTMPNIQINKFTLKKKIEYFSDIILFFKESKFSIDYEENIIRTNIDFISNTFFVVSRYEEYICEEKDIHERFSEKTSEIYKTGFLDRPIVNEYSKLLFEILKQLDTNIIRSNHWDESEYAFCVSHDIDSILKYRDKFLKAFLIKLLREKKIKEAVGKINKLIGTYKNIDNDPFWTFNYLLDLEKKYNFTASYYFMTGGSSNKDNCYNIRNKVLTSVFKNIRKNDSEIGIHGSYNSYNETETLQNEINELNFIGEIAGIRQHYLRFDIKTTWKNQSECGLKYDTTLGFAGVCGFRAGLCSPFRPFNLQDRKVINIWEVPLIVMDGTLSDEQYMNLDTEEAIKYVKLLMDRVRAVNGVFTLLWHNSSFDETSKWGEWRSIYESILKYAYDTNAMGLSGIKLINQYSK